MTTNYQATSAYYQIGGSLRVDSPSYVPRQADKNLYHGLKAGDICYVFNSRQMGKSSLRVRIMQRLQQEGIKCGVLDITGIGSQEVSPSEWYQSAVRRLTSSFGLQVKAVNWWAEREGSSPVDRFSEFIEDVLLATGDKFVIFIDEIDAIIKVRFKDDFFAAIRACYNQRVDNPAYNRLTFCLLGVATPTDLIQDEYRTPFNLGRAIELTGFKLQDAQKSLSPGLKDKIDNPDKILAEVLDWTGGQPFLTQKLCKLVVEKAESRNPHLESLVKTYIIQNWEAQDEQAHFTTIRKRLLSNEQRTSRLLGLYQQILHQGKIAADGSREQTELRLSGLVVQQNGYLQVYNPIYEAIFNSEWVEQELAKLRPYNEAIKAWLESNRQDSSRLLRGQALEEALHWSADKNLNPDDYAFFSASQELAMRELQRDLAAEREANQILEQAKQEAEQLTQEAKEGTKIERAGVGALREFEAKSRQEIKALLLAMEAGQALQRLVRNKSSLKEYPATSPLIALQVILDNIRERNQFTGHQGGVNSVSFSPDGNTLATASDDGTARLWDLSGNQIGELRGHQDRVWSVSFSPDGNTLATASDDRTARLWDLSGHQIGELRGHQGGVRSVSFSPDGKTLATASADGTARLWNLSGKQIGELRGHQGGVRSVCFSPDGKTLATASDDRTARLWNLSRKQIGELRGHQDWVTSVSFSPDGKTLATASSDRTARLWDLSGHQIGELRGHQDWVRSVSFSPDGNTLATASDDRTARLWDLSGNQIGELRGHQGWVTSVSFSPDGNTLATASNDRTARLWDLSGHQIGEFRGHQGGVWSVCFSPDGNTLATASDDGTARLWDLSGNQIGEFRGHQGWVTSVSFSPDGNTLATASNDRTARLWDLSGHQIGELRGHQGRVRSVCFSPDGKTLATASDDRTARLWDLSGHQIGELRGHQDRVTSVCFSRDGKTLATASDDRTARLWDLSGNQIGELRGHQDWVWSVCLSRDGKTLATASDDRTARLWDLSGNQIGEFRGHQGGVRSVCFSPDGKTLATASADGTARLWDLSGNQIGEFRGHQGGVRSVCFSPDGNTLATASDDRTARLWRVRTLDELLAQGYEWLGDYLASHPEARERLRG